MFVAIHYSVLVARNGYIRNIVVYVQNSHPILIILISLLFIMIIIHGMVPVDFCRGIIIPLIKNNEGNKTSSDNYRATVQC